MVIKGSENLTFMKRTHSFSSLILDITRGDAKYDEPLHILNKLYCESPYNLKRIALLKFN